MSYDYVHGYGWIRIRIPGLNFFFWCDMDSGVIYS